jgi:hypothetical protein
MKVLKLAHRELSPITSDNIIGYAELVYDLSDEFHRLSSCNRSYRLYFNPFCKFIHSTKICVNPPLAFLNGPTKSSPHVGKGHVIGMVWS